MREREVIHSFDVFDTCISRMHAYPRDLFYDLGLRVAASSSIASRESFAKRFQRTRIRAEKIAHWYARRRGREHADIDAIYKILVRLMRMRLSVSRLVDEEIALEEQSIYPITECVEKILVLRREGHRIVFISDMYIPGKLLGPMLERMGIAQMGDGLYVSCDVGTSKHSGGLFRHVLQAEGISPEQLLHTGDNAHADIRMAGALGIRTRHFTAAHLTKRETQIAGVRMRRTPATSWQAAFSRRCRLELRQSHGGATHPLDPVILGVISPFLMAYVLWVLDDARRRGIQRLYFVARDGEILLKIARELEPEGIELRYLHGSRRAWLAPSIVPDDPDWKRLLVVSGNTSAPRDIAVRAGLSEADQTRIRSILNLSDAAWQTSLNLDNAHAFVNVLVNDTKCKSVLMHSAAAKRETALSYFRQEGLLDGTVWALVDAGWSLNGQAALKRILSLDSQPTSPPQGYYLGLARDHLDQARAGKAYSFCQPTGNIFTRRRVVVEHCFLPATHASTQGYVSEEGRVVPNFSPDPRSPEELKYADRLHKATSIAARLIGNSRSMREQMEASSARSKESAAEFIRAPTLDDASFYSALAAIADMRQELEFSQSLCRPLVWSDVWITLRMALSKRAAFKTSPWMWLEGSIALSPAYIRLPIRLMLLADGLRNQLKLPRFPRVDQKAKGN